MASIATLHDQVYSYLREINQKDPTFRFTIRKSDKENRLTKGYYFYGNDNYLAVSFWSGTNWKNRTPNIIFVIVPGNHSTYLEIAVADSELKQKFVNTFITPRINLYFENGKLYRNITGNNFLEALGNFINNEKKIIDEVIEEQASFFGNVDAENRIGFIKERLFNLRLKKVDALRQKKLSQKTIQDSIYLKSLTVKNLSGINELSLGELTKDTQWIFLTGENGSGKTTILRALTLALCEDVPRNWLDTESGHYEIASEIFEGDRIIKNPYSADLGKPSSNTIVKGFAAYGASRLTITDIDTKRQLNKAELKKRTGTAYSIFHHNGILFDFSEEVRRLSDASSEAEGEEKLNILIETLTECIDPLANIIFFEGKQDDNSEVIEAKCRFIEKDLDDKHFQDVPFQHLSSGTKSIIAMIGDMIIRLFRQQPKIYDLGELKGIVLIDEIDIHLHPSQQRNLVQTLTKSFPKIQFIVTTHSPIPLLGAPKDSIIFRVKRTVKDGVIAERVDSKVNFYDLLPNTILTSPIFGLDTVVPDAQQQPESVRTERNWRELKFNDEVEKELSEIYRRLSQ